MRYTWAELRYAIAPFTDIRFQRLMLTNEQKYMGFYKALRCNISDVCHVLDIGSGSGVLAVMAAFMGAEKVIAVERPQVASLTKHVFERYPLLRDRLHLVVGDFFDLEPPSRQFDVIISETLGYCGFEENLWAIMSHACRKWARSDAIVLPRAIVLTPIGHLGACEGAASEPHLCTSSPPTKGLLFVQEGQCVDLTSKVPDVIRLCWYSRPRCACTIDCLTLISEAILDGETRIGNSGSCHEWPRLVIPLPRALSLDGNELVELTLRIKPLRRQALIDFTLVATGSDELHLSFLTDAVDGGALRCSLNERMIPEPLDIMVERLLCRLGLPEHVDE